MNETKKEVTSSLTYIYKCLIAWLSVITFVLRCQLWHWIPSVSFFFFLSPTTTTTHESMSAEIKSSSRTRDTHSKSSELTRTAPRNPRPRRSHLFTHLEGGGQSRRAAAATCGCDSASRRTPQSPETTPGCRACAVRRTGNDPHR